MTKALWAVATLAPWTVAPHPNFQQESVTHPQFLALIVDMRLESIERYRDRIVSSNEEWANDLVRAAESYILANDESQFATLIGIARDDSVAVDARCAAVLVAALDLRLQQATVVEKAIEAVVNSIESDDAASEIMRSALILQRALRRLDRNLEVDAAELQSVAQGCRVIRTEDVADSHGESASISPGVEISWAEVVVDLAQSLATHSYDLLTTVEGFSGSSWTHVIRSRPTWTDTRIQQRAATGDAQVAAISARRRADALVNRTRFGGEEVPGLRSSYSALQLAEVSANYSAALRARSALARLLVENRSSWDENERVGVLRDALKLASLSRSKDDLTVAIASLRTNGPIESISQVVQELADSITTTGRRARGNDLRLINAGVDLLSRDSCHVLWEQIGRRPPHGEEAQRLWLELARSLTAAIPHQVVIDSVLSARDEFVSASFISGEVQRLSASIEWPAVSEGSSRKWRSWLVEKFGENQGIRRRMLAAAGEKAIPAELPTDERVIAFLTDDPPDIEDVEAVRDARALLNSALGKAQDTRGISFGASDEADLAALVALRTGDPDLWNLLADFLVNTRVPADYKIGAIGRLADNGHDIPLHVRQKLANEWENFGRSPEILNFFHRSPKAAISGYVLLAAELQAEPKEYLLTSVMRLAEDDDPASRRDAASILPKIAVHAGAEEWGAAMLLHLCEDSDTTVLAAALRSLPALLTVDGALKVVVGERVEEALLADSVRRPLFALQGLGQVPLSETARERWLAIVEGLATSHRSRVVRGAARTVASDWKG